MYSNEIQSILEAHRYSLPSYLYIKICSTSPQISQIKYDSFSNDFQIWTYDNYYWKFTVYYSEEKYV